MSETPQRATRRLPALLPLPPKPAGSSMLVGGLLQYHQDGGGTLIGPSGPPKPMVGARRWMGCSSGEKSAWTSWVLAMLLVPFVIACQGLAATARDHLAVPLDVVRSAPPTTIHGPMDRLEIVVIELKKTDNSLGNATWITRIYRVKRLTKMDVVFLCFIDLLLKATILQTDRLFGGLPLTTNYLFAKLQDI
ncbi:hypothetical protein BU17DRAFT_70404 [Hysterangium stoloniferum]|nr:hypothetical protein BU17DRAFT_70404 [Hysterangium stoloniferum]